MKNKFALRLKELRIENHLTQKDLAKELNLSPRLVSYYESGERECCFDTLLKISIFFEVSTDYILGVSDI